MANQNRVSFAKDVLPMFRSVDIEHMRPMDVALDDYAYMSNRENAESVRDFITGAKQPQMPPGGPFWTQEQIDLLSRWIDEGCGP